MHEKEVAGERRLWVVVVSKGAQDLCSRDNMVAFKAALYFFTEDNDIYTPIQTLDGVCRANNLDPDRVAKKVWNKLNPNQQERIKSLLSRYRLRKLNSPLKRTNLVQTEASCLV